MLLTANVYGPIGIFSVAGATGNASVSVTAKSAVPFSQSLVFFSLLPVHSRLATLATQLVTKRALPT